MAENEDGQEKKHDPTDRNWEEAAERGQTPRSADVNSAAILLAGGAALAFGSGPMEEAHRRLFTHFLGGVDGPPLDAQSTLELLQLASLAIGASLAVPLGAVSVAAVAANLVQTRMQLAPKALEPDINRLNLLTGFQNAYLSWTPLVELGKGLGKFLALGIAAYFAVGSSILELANLSLVSPGELVGVLAALGWKLVASALPLIVILAVGDYAYTYWKMREQLKRTDKDVKDDQKNSEGDPAIRAQRRQRARELILNGSLAAVAEADLVVTNPTHYAVALRYRRGRDVAPIVVAKGVDHGAARIRRAAREAGVPRIENRPLARSLWRKAKVNKPIPESLYGPVAKVLAVVWARRRKR